MFRHGCNGGGSVSSSDSESTGHVVSTSLGTASTPVPAVLNERNTARTCISNRSAEPRST